MQKGVIGLPSEIEAVGNPYTALWACVMVRGVLDMDDRSKPVSTDAKEWCWSDEQTPGSFWWICEMLDLDYNKIQMACLTREGRSRLTSRSWWTTG